MPDQIVHERDDEEYGWAVAPSSQSNGLNGNGGDMPVIRVPDDMPLKRTKIAKGYSHIECVVCSFKFWAWDRYDRDSITCPKCGMPLTVVD
jgi:hypothetical protein